MDGVSWGSMVQVCWITLTTYFNGFSWQYPLILYLALLDIKDDFLDNSDTVVTLDGG